MPLEYFHNSGELPESCRGSPEMQGVRVEAPASAGLLGFEPVAPSRQIHVELSDISAAVPNLLGSSPSLLARLRGAFRRGTEVAVADDPKRYRQVLFDVSGSVKPGEVLALMGPSGSGKTTLLSIIGSRQQKNMRVQGRVTFNGQKLIKRLKRNVGYVMQDDLLYETLTVHETLHYAAMLRLRRTMSREEKAERVEAVIRALGLDTCRDTIIGGFFRKGISGGERKRTSVGHELLINPSLLLLDEPISGLDSTTAMHLLSVLRQLAAGGRCVISTLHQPSSRLYQQLDKLMLLSQGHVMYYGEAAAALEFFDALGYRLPYGINMADFLLDLASGDVAGGGRDGEASRQYLVRRSEAYLRRHALDGFRSFRGAGAALPPAPDTPSHRGDGGAQGEQGAEAGGGPPPSPPSPPPPAAAWGERSRSRHTALSLENGKEEEEEEGWHEEGQRGSGGFASWAAGPGASSRAFSVEGSSRRSGEGGGLGEGESRWGAPFHLQAAYLFRRALRTRRFETLGKQDIIQYITIAVLAGLFWLQKANENTLLSARNTVGLLFFELMFLSIRALFTALLTFPAEHKLLLKERASGMFRLSAWYAARTLSDAPMDLAVPTVFMVILYFMTGLRANPAAFFANYGVNILALMVAQGIGLLIGILVPNPKSSLTVASITMLTMVLTGGFFVVNLPAWISWLKYLSYIYYALGILLYVEFDGGHRQLYRCIDTNPAVEQCTMTDPSSPETTPGCAPVNNLQSALGLVQDPGSSGEAVRDGMVLLGFMIFFRMAVYQALKRKTRGF